MVNCKDGRCGECAECQVTDLMKKLAKALKVVEAARAGMLTGSSEALRDALREYDRNNS